MQREQYEEFPELVAQARNRIPHFPLIELGIEGLEAEAHIFGEEIKASLILSRIYLRDIQEIPMEDGSPRRPIPDCYSNIICNPEIESEYTRSYSINRANTMQTEDFQSAVEEGFTPDFY